MEISGGNGFSALRLCESTDGEGAASLAAVLTARLCLQPGRALSRCARLWRGSSESSS